MTFAQAYLLVGLTLSTALTLRILQTKTQPNDNVVAAFAAWLTVALIWPVAIACAILRRR